MTALRLFAIAVILVVASVGWLVLGESIQFRTNDAGARGGADVGMLWGGPQIQTAPTFSAGSSRLEVASSDITADFNLEQRRRGLLWYSTYLVDFDAAYRLRNGSDEPMRVRMDLAFPASDGVYDGFGVSVDGTDVGVRYGEGSATATFDIPAGKEVSVATGYKTQGQNEWRYEPTLGVGVIEDFSLVMTTDFENVDFPVDGVSPTGKRTSGPGWELKWDYESLVSGRPIAISMPTPLNPGPVASRIAFFAPVSLIFYFAAMVLLSATRRVRMHPMNYAFLAAGFFAFHLLFAYLVDRIDLSVAFGIAATVSTLLCVGYLALALRDRRTVAEAAVAQVVFLVLFSLSFFFEGFTGLAVTIGAILTLAYFMVRTARMDWSDIFTARTVAAPPSPPGDPLPLFSPAD